MIFYKSLSNLLYILVNHGFDRIKRLFKILLLFICLSYVVQSVFHVPVILFVPAKSDWLSLTCYWAIL